MSQERYAEAESLCNDSLKINRATLPEGHTLIATSLTNLAHLYYRQVRYAEAEPLQQEAVAINLRSFGDKHPVVQNEIMGHIMCLRAKGRLEEFLLTLPPDYREIYQRIIDQNGSNA